MLEDAALGPPGEEPELRHDFESVVVEVPIGLALGGADADAAKEPFLLRRHFELEADRLAEEFAEVNRGPPLGPAIDRVLE